MFKIILYLCASLIMRTSRSPTPAIEQITTTTEPTFTSATKYNEPDSIDVLLSATQQSPTHSQPHSTTEEDTIKVTTEIPTTITELATDVPDGIVVLKRQNHSILWFCLFHSCFGFHTGNSSFLYFVNYINV